MLVRVIPEDELERLQKIEQLARTSLGPGHNFLEASRARLALKYELGLIDKDEERELYQFLEKNSVRRR